MAIFPTFFFLGNIGKENVYYDILEPKNDFLGYKNNKSKQSKNSQFSKGFGPKIATIPTFFLSNIGQENVFYDILEAKNPILGYKNKKSKKNLEKWSFLDQHHGLTPLEKCQFFNFLDFLFL